MSRKYEPCERLGGEFRLPSEEARRRARQVWLRNEQERFHRIVEGPVYMPKYEMTRCEKVETYLMWLVACFTLFPLALILVGPYALYDKLKARRRKRKNTDSKSPATPPRAERRSTPSAPSRGTSARCGPPPDGDASAA